MDQRNLNFLKDIVKKIWKVIWGAGKHAQELYPELKKTKYPDFPEELTFLTAEEILDLIERLNRELRKTIIMVTHDPRAARRARTIRNLEKELRNKQFTIIHIASHGHFESDVRESFLLTFDGKLTMGKLEEYVGLFKFRQDPLELLTLSACETASGDDRAALGLAGIAIKSDDSYVYVADYGANYLRPVKVSSQLVETSVQVGTSPYGLVLSGSTIWVTNYGSSNVMAVDTSTGGIVATVTTASIRKGLQLRETAPIFILQTSALYMGR
jgi:hypothetical protein